MQFIHLRIPNINFTTLLAIKFLGGRTNFCFFIYAFFSKIVVLKIVLNNTAILYNTILILEVREFLHVIWRSIEIKLKIFVTKKYRFFLVSVVTSYTLQLYLINVITTTLSKYLKIVLKQFTVNYKLWNLWLTHKIILLLLLKVF